ncbi:hypothetical protein ACLOJK_005498 [Asimina triloba]
MGQARQRRRDRRREKEMGSGGKMVARMREGKWNLGFRLQGKRGNGVGSRAVREIVAADDEIVTGNKGEDNTAGDDLSVNMGEDPVVTIIAFPVPDHDLIEENPTKVAANTTTIDDLVMGDECPSIDLIGGDVLATMVLRWSRPILWMIRLSVWASITTIGDKNSTSFFSVKGDAFSSHESIDDVHFLLIPLFIMCLIRHLQMIRLTHLSSKM